MNREVLVSTYKHWIWANYMKRLFENEMKTSNDYNWDDKNDEQKFINEFFIIKGNVYMFVWYGLLFAVCERIKQEEIIIPEIQNDLNDIYDKLKLFRNATFHIQEKYNSKKFIQIMIDKGSANKINNVHEGLGSFLLEKMKKSKGENKNA